jgi:cytochrome P450
MNHDASLGAPDVREVDWEPNERRYPEGLRDTRWVGEVNRLREECPVAYADEFGGFYSLTRYRDVCRAALEHQTFESGQQFVRIPSLFTIPGSLNPPEHTVFRRMLNQYFTTARMQALAPQIADCANGLLDPLLARGHGDLVREFCQPLAARSLALLMNLGEDAYRDMLANFDRFDALGWEPQAVNELLVKVLREHIARLVADRRSHPMPAEDDLMSGAMSMEIDGVPLDDEHVIAIGVGMIGAGHSTTADALSSAVFRLATDPYLQSQLRAAPELVGGAVEEFVRLDAPVAERSRRAVTDVEIAGRTIPTGSLVALNIGAANLDPAQFEHPEACIVDRSPNRHIGFGHGVHKCVGAPLARIEMKIAIQQLLVRTDGFALNAAAENSPGLILKGLAKVPVRFTTARRSRSCPPARPEPVGKDAINDAQSHG